MNEKTEIRVFIKCRTGLDINKKFMNSIHFICAVLRSVKAFNAEKLSVNFARPKIGQKGDELIPASILYKSTAGRYRPVSYPDGPITARYRFM